MELLAWDITMALFQVVCERRCIDLSVLGALGTNCVMIYTFLGLLNYHGLHLQKQKLYG